VDYRGEPHRVEFVAADLRDVEFFLMTAGQMAPPSPHWQAQMHRKPVVILQRGQGQDHPPVPVMRYARAVVRSGDAIDLRCPAALPGRSRCGVAGRWIRHGTRGRPARQAQQTDAVLMSPACASFDMFDYEHRARADAVLALARSGQ
jgi:UDP-N-acetylmuramoylalanine--D-glutamate ligase